MQASKKRQDQLLNPGGAPPQLLHPQQNSPLMTPTSILSPLRNNSKTPLGLVPTARTPTPTSQFLHQQNIPNGANGRGSPYAQASPNHYPANGGSNVMDDPYQASSIHRRKGGRSEDLHGSYENDSEAAGPASMLFQQQQYAPQADQYIQNRSTAIEAVESTLQELGGIFQQLAQMVAEQRDTVQR